MNLWNETKSVPISRQMIWEAYKKVKANKGIGGVDNVSMEEFDADRSKHLYKLWNRMASGCYFPPPVKEVEIEKQTEEPENMEFQPLQTGQDKWQSGTTLNPCWRKYSVQIPIAVK
jgi:retron-type reverse transcriptase